MHIITRFLTATKFKYSLLDFLILLIGLSTNTYAIEKTNIDLAVDFLKSQPSISKDSEITIHPMVGQHSLESCQDIYFSTFPYHNSTSLRFLANCNTPQRWTIFLNATITQKQKYFITRRAIKRGEMIALKDLQANYDSKTSPASNFVTKSDEVNNLAAAHDIKIGTILRHNDLSEPILVTRYEQVKIITKSNGFSVTTFGKALNNATKGHTVRVQLSNKHVISGKAVSAGTIEISN